MTYDAIVARHFGKISAMFSMVRHLVGWMISAFGSRQALVIENLALRQQLLALQGKHPQRRLSPMYKLFWVLLRRLWSGWKAPLVLVTPRTVVEWHRAGFRLYWKWLSRARCIGGRKPVSKEVRTLIFRMAAENPTWEAPRIHGEVLKLGFQISEPTFRDGSNEHRRTRMPCPTVIIRIESNDRRSCAVLRMNGWGRKPSSCGWKVIVYVSIAGENCTF